MVSMVTIYSTVWCAFCHAAKEYFKTRGVEFKEVDVTNDQKNLQHMVDISGQMGVPVIDIDGSIVVGFNRPAIEATLRQKNLV